MALITSKNKAFKDKILFMKETNLSLFVPVFLIGLILIFVILFITNYTLRQSGKVIGNQIAERGKRTILLYESIALGKINFDVPVDKASLIRNLGNQKGFVFLAITDAYGKVIVHNDKEKTNDNINIHNTDESEEPFERRITTLLPYTDGEGTNWGSVIVDNEPLFLIHRIFGEGQENTETDTHVPLEGKTLKLDNTRHVFAAMQPATLEKALAIHRQKSFHMAFWAIGISLFFLCFFALICRIFINRKRMAVAEKTIITMHEVVQRLESEIQKQEKLVIIGNLAAGVAHEIRNPLSSIKGYATYFTSIFPEKSENQKAAYIMASEVDRLNRVVGDLIGVSRPTDIKTGQISLRSIIDSTTQLLSQDAKQLGIELNTCGTDQIAQIDPDRFKQALLNIILNAIEAFKKHGMANQIERAKIDIILSETKKDVLIKVSDNGHGMDEATLKRIFDPYFTTKSQGTGLGLVNANKIIEAHGGSISVISEKSLGTTFTIQIPKDSMQIAKKL